MGRLRSVSASTPESDYGRMSAVNREARAIWIDEKARTAGFSDGADLARRFGLKPYRIAQLYRAATRELLSDIDDISVLPKDLRSGLRQAASNSIHSRRLRCSARTIGKLQKRSSLCAIASK